MVNVAIVDDDQKDLKLLTDYIKKYGCEYGIDFSVKQFTSGELFLIEYKKGFDIVFLDIDMPNLDGMETAKKLREVDEKVAIVFETVLAHRAIDGYSVEAINYIVKPFSYADFVLKMSHIKNRLTLKQSNLITIHGAHTITNISLNEVYYIDILRHYLTYHTTHGNITARGTMSEVEEKLSSYNFIRISNSHIVNLMKIKSVRTNEIVINGATLSISRTYKKQFLDAFSKVVISNISGGGYGRPRIMTADLFDQLLFMAELIVCELMFTLPVAAKKNHFYVKATVGAIVSLAASFCYLALIQILSTIESETLQSFVIMAWYTALVLLTFFCLGICFKLPLGQIVFRGIAGYVVQHVDFVLINRVYALAFQPEIRDVLWLYALITIFSFSLHCLIFYFIFVNKFKDVGNVMIGNKVITFIVYILIFFTTVYATVTFGRLFRNGSYTQNFTPNFPAIICDLIYCATLIFLLYCLCQNNKTKHEVDVINGILYENGKQYKMRKEAVELLNHKCHDLKHQIAAMKLLSPEEQQKSLDELQNLVMFYDSTPKTDNEVLNTILMEKELFCLEHGVKINFVGDGSLLKFMDTLDLYSLFGNALDNAVESVVKIDDPAQKTIDCYLSLFNNTICLKMSNYVNSDIALNNTQSVTASSNVKSTSSSIASKAKANSTSSSVASKAKANSNSSSVASKANVKSTYFPPTSKSDSQYHGIGLKSINRIAEKYNGNINISVTNNIFTLTIILPLPPATV